jgi:hypothetical protein
MTNYKSFGKGFDTGDATIMPSELEDGIIWSDFRTAKAADVPFMVDSPIPSLAIETATPVWFARILCTSRLALARQGSRNCPSLFARLVPCNPSARILIPPFGARQAWRSADTAVISRRVDRDCLLYGKLGSRTLRSACWLGGGGVR